MHADPRRFRMLALVAAVGAVALAVVALAADLGPWWILAFALLALGAGRLYWAALREQQRERHEEELLDGPSRDAPREA